MADTRKVTPDTILTHIEKLREKHGADAPDVDYLRREFKRSELDDILEVFEKLGPAPLSPVYYALQKKKKTQTYVKIRLARLFMND